MVINTWDFGSSIKSSELTVQQSIIIQELLQVTNALPNHHGEIVQLFTCSREVR